MIHYKSKKIDAGQLHYLHAHDWESLSKIQKSQYNIGILKRPEARSIDAFVEHLVDTDLETVRSIGAVDKVIDDLKQEMLLHGLQNKPGFDAFMADATDLANGFSRLSGSLELKLYFAIVESNMCRLFHTDINDLRLLCTYHGPGTLWVKNENIRWDKMGSTDNNDLIVDEDAVEQTMAFDITILKGALHPNNDTCPVFHRSPVVEGTGHKRVLLRLDTCTFMPGLS